MNLVSGEMDVANGKMHAADVKWMLQAVKCIL